MRILFLTTHLNAGGITQYLFNLSGEFIKAGHQVFVISSGGDMRSRFEDLGVVHLALNIRTKSELSPRIYLALKDASAFIREHKIDVIHAHTRVTQVMAFFLKNMTGVPVCTTCHGFFRPKWARRLFPGWGDRVIAVSSAVRQHLEDDFHWPAQKISTIKNGIDIFAVETVAKETRNRRKQELDCSGRPVIGIIARLSDVKGHDILIRALEAVRRQIPDVLLCIVGKGREEQTLKQMVAQLKLDEHARFYPVVNQTADYLQAFDVFVMPSRQEGLGLSVMEAQAAGLPVVASNVGGIPSLIQPESTGILVEPENAEALAAALIRVLQDPQLASALGRQARRALESEQPLKHMAEQTLSVYEGLIAL